MNLIKHIIIGFLIIGLLGWFAFPKKAHQLKNEIMSLFSSVSHKKKQLRITAQELNKIIATIGSDKRLSSADDTEEKKSELYEAFDKAGKRVKPVALNLKQAYKLAQGTVPKVIKRLQVEIEKIVQKRGEGHKKFRIWSFMVGIDGDRAKAYQVKVIMDLTMIELQKLGKISDYKMIERPRGQDNYSDVPVDLVFTLN